MVVWWILIALVVIYVLKGIIIIQQAEAVIVERLGKFEKELSPGLNFIFPILEAPRAISWKITQKLPNGESYSYIKDRVKIDLRESVYDFPRQNVITKDNVTTSINALLYFQITDPFKSVYEIENLPNAIEKLTQTTLRNIIGELELDETLTSRDTINSRLREVLDEATNKWGVKVNRVELQDITPPESVRRAMEQQMQAERERRAKILKAEGDKTSKILYSEGEKEAQINQAKAQKESQILMAQGEAEAKILQAKAEAEAIEKLAEAIKGTNSDPASYQIALKYIETLKEMASGKDNKTVYIPYEATSLLGSLGGIKEILKG